MVTALSTPLRQQMRGSAGLHLAALPSFFLIAGVLFLGGCTASATNHNPPATLQPPVVTDGTALLKCQKTNEVLTADRDLKVAERNECIDKYNAFVNNYNVELSQKSEYGTVLDYCYSNKLEFETTGVQASAVCPTCNFRSSCDSQSMMPLFGCKSELRLDTVSFENDIAVCDVIAYNRPSGIPLLHRVWKVYKDEQGVTRFKTAGDNSQQLDDYDPSFKDIIGEVARVTTS